MCLSKSSSASLLLVVFFFVNYTGSPADAAPLSLFEDSNFLGASSDYRLLEESETCFNIRGKLNDRFSSVMSQPGDCYLLCEHESCRGRCVEIKGNITDLNSIEFNDTASSLKRCPSPTSSILQESKSTSRTLPSSSTEIGTSRTTTEEIRNNSTTPSVDPSHAATNS